MTSLNKLISLALVALTTASPLSLYKRQTDEPLTTPYTLPSNASDTISRAAAIEVKRETFTYVPGLGGGPFWPNGSLGQSYISNDSTIDNQELYAQLSVVANDSNYATANASQVGISTPTAHANLY